MVYAFRVTLIFIDDKIVFLLDVDASNASGKFKKTTDRCNALFNQFIKRWQLLDDGPTELFEGYEKFLDSQDKEVR